MSELARSVPDYEPLLMDYLIQRFGSASLAREITQETCRRLDGSEILGVVGDPEVYVMGYALALGLHWSSSVETSGRSGGGA